jgi:hypothetical protein
MLLAKLETTLIFRMVIFLLNLIINLLLDKNLVSTYDEQPY